MKLKKLKIKNFLSYGNEAQIIDFTGSPITYIVGPNNSGKSNIFRTLNFVADSTQMGKPTTFPFEMLLEQRRRDFEMSVDLEMSDVELQAMKDLLILALAAIQMSGNPPVNLIRTSLKNEILEHHAETIFSVIKKDVSIIVKGTDNEDRPIEHFVKVQFGDEIFFINEAGYLSNRMSASRHGGSLYNFYDLLIEDYERRYLGGISMTDKTSDKLESSYSPPVLSNLLHSKLSTEESSPNYDNFLGIMLPSLDIRSYSQYYSGIGYARQFERFTEILKDLGYVGDAISFQSLISIIYSSALIWVPDMRGRVPDYEQVSWERGESKVLGSWETNYANPIMPSRIYEENLPSRLFNLSNGAKLSMYRKFEGIKSKFTEFTNGTEFRLTTPEKLVPSEHMQKSRVLTSVNPFENQERSPQLNEEEVNRKVKVVALELMKDDFYWPISFSSAGTVEALTLLTAVAESQDKILLLDEPAQNMHPNFQIKFLNHMLKNTNGGQVIITTHSPFMLSKAKIEEIWRVNRNDGYTRILSVSDALSEKKVKYPPKILEELDRSDIRALLFSRGAVFVEGLSDKWTLELLESKLMLEEKGIGLYENDWTIARLDTKYNVKKYLEFAEATELNFVFLLDRDAVNDVKKIFEKKGMGRIDERALREKGFIFLPSDLDHLLGFEGDGKPWKALSKIMDMRVEDIPDALKEAINYIHERVSFTKR